MVAVLCARASQGGNAVTETRKHLTLLLLLCAMFFLGNGALSITDQVESNYVLTAKEMLASGDYFSPRIYGSYWYDKPAFFYWELIAAFSLFGTTDFAARLFPGIFASIGVFLTYAFGRQLYDARTGFFAAGILATSVGYWIAAKSVITDTTLFVFLNASLVFFYLGYTRDRRLYYAAWISAACAVLTKGPVGIVLPGLIILMFLLVRRDIGELRRIKPLGLGLFVLVGGQLVRRNVRTARYGVYLDLLRRTQCPACDSRGTRGVECLVFLPCHLPRHLLSVELSVDPATDSPFAQGPAGDCAGYTVSSDLGPWCQRILSGNGNKILDLYPACADALCPTHRTPPDAVRSCHAPPGSLCRMYRGGGQSSCFLQLMHWTDVLLRCSKFRDSRGIVWLSCSRENGRHPC